MEYGWQRTAWTSLDNAMYGTSHRTGFQLILDRFTGSEGLSNMIDFGLSMATGAGVAKLGRLMNMVDDAGRCMSFLTRLNLGLCFTGDTLVHVTALAGDTAPADHAAWPVLDDEGVSAVTVASAAAGVTATLVEPVRAAAAASFTLPIRDVPLGSRVLAGNPRPEEFDETWSEPEQATWVTLGLALVKPDRTPVTAEFLRPREWVDRLGLRAGAPLPIAVTELEVEGDALVTSITPCPPIAEGSGRVVTGRFVTQAAGNLVRVLLADGTEIRATDVHPVWSVDREEWVPAGELLFGEVLDTLAGPVAVEWVERLESPLDVYTIEVHGEHVFRITADGVLVHNACASTSGNNLAARIGQQMHASYRAGQADFITTFKEKLLPSGRKIDFLDIAQGIVYELKPNNAKAIARGMRQAASYVKELNSLFPGMNWKIVVDVY